MPPTTLESLPEEILLEICEYLGRDYMASVAAIACASNYCYFAVTALLVRTIKFDVSTRPKLLRDVQEYYDMLQRTRSFRHVRRLVVDGYWPSHGDDLKPNYQWHRPAISAKERGYGDEILDWRVLGDAYATPATIESVYETNDDWRQLADLVKQLPSLLDLIFACNSHFPPCLLQALQHQGQCRLHISRLRLRSLGAPTMDTHEFNLVSSPCLCSIGLVYYETRPLEFHLMPGSVHDGPSYPREAAIRLVAGLAPNLKELHLFQHSPSRFQ